MASRLVETVRTHLDRASHGCMPQDPDPNVTALKAIQDSLDRQKRLAAATELARRIGGNVSGQR